MNKNVIIDTDEKGIIFLKSDKYELVCPFRNPYMVPGRMQGSFAIAKETCNSTCPHFHHTVEQDENNGSDQDCVRLTCGKTLISFQQDK